MFEICCCFGLVANVFGFLFLLFAIAHGFLKLSPQAKKTLLAIVAILLFIGLVVFVIFRWIDFFDTYF